MGKQEGKLKAGQGKEGNEASPPHPFCGGKCGPHHWRESGSLIVRILLGDISRVTGDIIFMPSHHLKIHHLMNPRVVTKREPARNVLSCLPNTLFSVLEKEK